jgi:hypothetical protein
MFNVLPNPNTSSPLDVSQLLQEIDAKMGPISTLATKVDDLQTLLKDLKLKIDEDRQKLVKDVNNNLVPQEGGSKKKASTKKTKKKTTKPAKK